MIKNLLFSILLMLFATSIYFGQITITPLPISKDIPSESNFININSTGKLIPLNKSWFVYPDEKSDFKTKTTIPCVFEGASTLVFETFLTFTQDEVENNLIKIQFLGVNNIIDVYLNNNSIFKKTGSELLTEIELPKDLIKISSPNSITLKVSSKLDSENTIPVKQRFLSPKYPVGIIREVFLKFLPLTHISNYKLNYSLNENLSAANTKINFVIKNPNLLQKPVQKTDQYSININVTPINFAGSPITIVQAINISSSELQSGNVEFSINNPVLWSPQTPNLYKVSLSLMYGKNVIDQIITDLAIFRFDTSQKNLTLNKIPFSFEGTALIINEADLKQSTIYTKLKTELELIKKTGFNTVRFSKTLPHPYAAKLCQELGLFCFIELPINSIPEEILSNDYFQLISSNKLSDIINQYSEFSKTIVYGLGSSYLSNSSITKDFLNKLINTTEDRNVLTYASFVGPQKADISGLDFYGIELYSNKIDRIKTWLDNNFENDNRSKYFFCEIYYPNYVNNSSGYLVKNSSEAQAKYFEEIIEFSKKNKLCGFVFSSLYDFRGDFASAYTGYSESNIYKIGILREKPNFGSITYKLVKAKLSRTEKVTIPIGSIKEENKLFFILIALALSLIMALLINIKKKFREDCTRALFRPYNFFADIRDLRIISGFHTLVLSLIEIGSISLLLTILAYYMRTNLLIEKIILSFGNYKFMEVFSYLSWKPEICFIYLFVFFILILFLLSGLVKLTSYFTKIRVLYSSILYTIVWALLPFTILLPVELILFKILAATTFNIYVIAFLAILFLWILQRILKGIHVIFDVRAFNVYLLGLLIIVIISGAIIFYHQWTNSTIYYINNSLRQYNLMSF